VVFLLCGEQPKINKLIFLIFIYRPLLALGRNEVCHQSEGQIYSPLTLSQKLLRPSSANLLL
jgi:hypothetical protein